MRSAVVRLLPLIFLLIFGSCSKPMSVVSSPTGQNYQIDGSSSEWTGHFILPKDQKFAFAVSHTKNYIYLAITSFEPDFRRQINMAGLTLWLDPKGKKSEHIAIKYAGRKMDFRKTGARMDSKRGMGRELTSEDFKRGTRAEGIEPLRGDLALILVGQDKRQRLGPADLLASAGSDEEGLFIEFQIPISLLGETDMINDQIGIGLISELKRPEARLSGAGRGQMNAGGSPGRGGRSGGMGGQRPGGMDSGQHGSVDDGDVEFWMKVSLQNS